MATLKTQSTAMAKALDAAEKAQAKPLQTALDSIAVINTAEDLKEFSNNVHEALIAKSWTEGSANAQRSKLRRILGTMAATDKKMVAAHSISNRDEGTALVLEMAQTARNISDLYTALAPAKQSEAEPTEADSVDAEPTTAEPLDSERLTLDQIFEELEGKALLHGHTLEEIALHAIHRYHVTVDPEGAETYEIREAA